MMCLIIHQYEVGIGGKKICEKLSPRLLLNFDACDLFPDRFGIFAQTELLPVCDEMKRPFWGVVFDLTSMGSRTCSANLDRHPSGMNRGIFRSDVVGSRTRSEERRVGKGG